MSATTGIPKANRKRVTFPSGVVFLATVQSGDIEETLQLLQKSVDPNSSSADGLTAHHQCCIDGNLEMLRVLVEHDADVNAQDNEGWTPLHAAASCDQSEICSYLLEHGADPTVINGDGQIPQDLCEEDENECLVLLQNALRDRNLNADEVRNAEMTAMMKDAVSIRDGLTPASAESLKFGATPLHVASAKGYIDVVEMLLDAGVEVNAVDDDGWTPLHAAAHWNQERSCELLTDYDADFKAVSKTGSTCFDVADSEVADKLNELQEAQSKRPPRPKKEPKKEPKPASSPPSPVEVHSPTLSSRRVTPPEITPVTTAQTTPPSSVLGSAACEHRRSVENIDPPTTEPETKRRQKARRSRETRRLTQHVRLEDLQAAAGPSSSPDVPSDDESHRENDVSGFEPRDNDASANELRENVAGSESRDNVSCSDPVIGHFHSKENRESKVKRRPTRRPRTERRQTGAVVPSDLTGTEMSASEGEGELDESANNTGTEASLRSPALPLDTTSPRLHVASPASDEPAAGRRRSGTILAGEEETERAPNDCLCSARLLTLEKQLEAMYETFDKDRSRVGVLEKELKQLREENRALIRVIAKLSRSP